MLTSMSGERVPPEVIRQLEDLVRRAKARADAERRRPVTPPATRPLNREAITTPSTPAVDRVRFLSAMDAVAVAPDYDDYVRQVLSIHAGLGPEGEEDFIRWARGGAKFNEAKDRDIYRRAKHRPGGITAATIYKQARETGWTGSGPQAASAGPAERANAPHFTVLTAAMVASRSIGGYVLKGVLHEGAIVAVYGAPGSGKSFFVMDMVRAIAVGVPWFGRRSKAAPVVIVALEGAAGIPGRVKAMQAQHGPLQGVHFILGQALDLRSPESVEALGRAIVDAGLTGAVVVIDTLAAAMVGADENSAQDMGGAVAGLQALQAIVGGVVIVVHHTGKDTTRGMRGSSALNGALDFAIEVTRKDNVRAWRVTKAKDGADDATGLFALQAVTVGTDEDGEPVTSCVVTAAASPVPSAQPAPALHPEQAARLAILRPLLDEGTVGAPGVPDRVRSIGWEAAVQALADSIGGADPRRGARRSLLKLLDQGHLGGTADGPIWACTGLQDGGGGNERE